MGFVKESVVANKSKSIYVLSYRDHGSKQRWRGHELYFSRAEAEKFVLNFEPFASWAEAQLL